MYPTSQRKTQKAKYQRRISEAIHRRSDSSRGCGRTSLSLTTIEGHLAYFVGTGRLSLEQLILPEKAARIAAYFQSHPYQGLTSAKEALGNEVSYGELRYVLKDLERQG